MYAQSQLSGRRSANRFGDEAHGYRIPLNQRVPKFVTASAKALMLLLFFPQPSFRLHYSYFSAVSEADSLEEIRRRNCVPIRSNESTLPACSDALGPTYRPEASSPYKLRRRN